MFTGIIEATGRIISIHVEGTNKRFTVESSISSALKPDQSVSHDGVCLTVVGVNGNHHEVVAVDETLSRSNLGHKQKGNVLNLERSVSLNARMDGHIVQGHVDDTAIVNRIVAKNGSWIFEFSYRKKEAALLVDKGSVSINGVSLTVIKPKRKKFSVAIIPYTYEHTNFRDLKEGDTVNIEFDIIGKYVQRMMELRK
jgi:riboflavin synthase